MEEGSVETSDAEDPSPAHGRARGGRGRGRGRGPQGPKGQKQPSNKGPKGQKKVSKCLKAKSLMSDVRRQSEGDVSTSETEETKRIHEAEAKWKPAQNHEGSVSSEECEGNADVKSSLLSFLSWVLEKVLSPGEVDALKRAPDFQLGELCAGMATGTIVLRALEMKLQEIHQISQKGQATFYSETVEWKREVCRIVHENCGGGKQGTEAAFLRRTSDLVAGPKTCNLLVGAIECDDISSLSSTPRSVLDASGRSGSSFLEMLDALKAMPSKPVFVVIECVASLGRMRSSVQEKGTEVVSEKLSELAYFGQWRTLNSKCFGLPQSRSRMYGVFVQLTRGFGPEGKSHHAQQIEKIWKLVERCQRPEPQSLQSLLEQADFQDDESKKKTKSKPKPAMKRPASKKAEPKWVKQHQAFRKKYQITDTELRHDAIKMLKKHRESLDVTEREVDASCLRLAIQLRGGKVNISCMVSNVGDSVGYLRWSSSIHPCVLPAKKYLYVLNGQLFTNADCKSNALYPLLQGLGPTEMELCGLNQKLSGAQIQELSGNAFSSNIVAAIMLAISCHWHE